MTARLGEPRSAAARANYGPAARVRVVDEFEQFLGDLSADLIRVPVSSIDAVIERWLERITIMMDVDRCNVAQIDPRDGILYTTHQWGRPGVLTPDRGLRVDNSQSYPWLTRKIFAGETVVLSTMSEVPPGVNDLASVRRNGGKSNVTIPLKIGDMVVGALLVGTVFSERQWSGETIRRLTLIAYVIANAVDRIRTESEQRSLLAKLRQISGIAMMSELTATLAHELNQPLGAVLNNARAAQRFLAAKKPDLNEIHDALDDIVRDNLRAVDTIRQLRSLFQGGESPRAQIDIPVLFGDIERIVRPDAASRGIDLRVELEPGVPSVSGDSTQLTQAILNLLSNAFDAVSGIEDRAHRVTLRGQSGSTGQFLVTVCDSGEGIDPGLVSKIFDPFVTTKSKGMGIGLAIVKTIVEAHGGLISVMANADFGTTFKFELPAASRSEIAS